MVNNSWRVSRRILELGPIVDGFERDVQDGGMDECLIRNTNLLSAYLRFNLW